MPIQDCSVHQLKEILAHNTGDVCLLDVRQNWEYETCAVENTLHIPLGDLPNHLDKLDKDKEIYVICHHGSRSRMAASLLAQNGYNKLYNVVGGIHAWAEHIEPSMEKY
jgi:rhodanese-related sulfurtransferase